jgi:hypothetical protein
MKNLTKIAISLMIISGAVFNVTGQTLKERIDQAKVVKVYFDNFPIHHNPNTEAQNPSMVGTGCPKFNETTPFPAEYADALKQLIDLLNKGFNTTAFIEGDLKTVPALNGKPLADLQYDQLMTGTPGANVYDFAKLDEPLIFYILSSGAYTVFNRFGSNSPERKDFINYLTFNSVLVVYSNPEGKKYTKLLELRNLVLTETKSNPSKECMDYNYFVTNFPLSLLTEVFKTSIVTKMNNFIEKEMAKYEKEMNKKKK